MKKVVLLDTYGEKEKMLIDSFLNTSEDIEAVVLEDISFLPKGVCSIYDAYLQQFETKQTFKDIYFAFVDAPNLAKIVPLWGDGAIYDEERKIADICVRGGEQRLVEHIEWLDGEKVYRKDYYDRYGYVYKQEHIDKENVVLDTSYIANHKEIMTVTNGNGVVTVLQKNKTKKLYYDISSWKKDFLNLICSNIDQIYVTSDIQKEMLEGKTFTDWTSVYNACLTSKETMQYVYKKTQRDILILTTSDQLEDIEVVIKELPQCHFHIAATTAFSNKICALDKYSNVSLYPSIGFNKLQTLLESCAMYLDINRYHAYPYSIQKASLYGLVLMGRSDIQHFRQYFLDENIFQDFSSMIKKIQKICMDQEYQRDIALKQYHYQKNNFTNFLKGQE